MSIYLVQHGLSLPKDIDPEKGLSEKGTAEVNRIADVAHGYGIRVAHIVHSGKKRARQTAEIFASKLQPVDGVTSLGGLNPLDDVTIFASRMDSASDTMYVGHLPFMERLAAFLLTGVYEKPVFKFQNGGIVSLYEDTDLGSWVIKWALMPKID
ncbi:phosphohistidine phosphatase SixA [Thermodesulfobacteriota bacterium]